jgi:hypothetical protein
VLKLLQDDFVIHEVMDLSAAEAVGTFLESTGVMIFDHAHKIAYAGISPRCDCKLFEVHARQLGYMPVAVTVADPHGVMIYHMNVVLAIQRTTAVLYADGIVDPEERHALVKNLEQTGHEIVYITFEQLEHFCANVLELRNVAGEHFLVMSQGAYDAFSVAARAILSKDKTILASPLPTIEAVGGGSARCMMAEIFLPRRPTI